MMCVRVKMSVGWWVGRGCGGAAVDGVHAQFDTWGTEGRYRCGNTRAASEQQSVVVGVMIWGESCAQ